MKNILIVDDEELFTRSLAEGLVRLDPSLRAYTAANGQKAVDVLATSEVDLVLTDIQMPVMDGFKLLAHMSRQHPQVPVLVMTAFGTEEIRERLKSVGVDCYVEKPVDFDVLARKISEVLQNSTSGYVQGITLSAFLQIIEMERKSCSLRISSEGREGRLYFNVGVLTDAETHDCSGDAAALEVVSWPEGRIEIVNGCRRKERRVTLPLIELLLESARIHDEKAEKTSVEATGESEFAKETLGDSIREVIKEKETNMNVQDKLKDLSVIDGFAGVAVFTPAGENLAVLSAANGFRPEVGVLANNVLINAQKSSLEMGAGRGQQVHIEAERAHILARCLNEGTDPLKSQPGKAHIHMVVVLSHDSSIGMAKMRMNSTIEKIAEDFRL